METRTVVVKLAEHTTLWLPWSIPALELRRWMILVELGELEEKIRRPALSFGSKQGTQSSTRVVRHGMAEVTDAEMRVLRN
jgi:hypothetical protein